MAIDKNKEYTSGDSDLGIEGQKQYNEMSKNEKLYHLKELWHICYIKSLNAHKIIFAFNKVHKNII